MGNSPRTMRVGTQRNTIRIGGVLLLSFVSLFFSARGANAVTAYEERTGITLPPNVRLFTYQTDHTLCHDELRSELGNNIQGIVTPSNPSQVGDVFLYFHGTGVHPPEDLCTGCTEACQTVGTAQDIAIVLFNRANPDYKTWFDETDQDGIVCAMNEVRDILSSIGVPASARFSLAGHSGGGNAILQFASKAELTFARTLFFDACYGDDPDDNWCLDALGPPRQTGSPFIYMTGDAGTRDRSIAAKQAYLTTVTLVDVPYAHDDVPKLCFFDYGK